MTPPPILVGIDGAAGALGISQTKVKQLIRRGDLHAKKLDRRTVITWASVSAFAAALPETSKAS